MKHTIRVNQRLSALDLDLADFTADVTVVWHRATSDGFNEPREPACAELDGVTQIDGPRIAASALSEWAAAWVAGHQDRIADEITEF